MLLTTIWSSIFENCQVEVVYLGAGRGRVYVNFICNQIKCDKMDTFQKNPTNASSLNLADSRSGHFGHLISCPGSRRKINPHFARGPLMAWTFVFRWVIFF